MMNAADVIRIGRSRSRLALIAALTGIRPSNSSCARELDDQDGMLCREADQDDQADLGEDVVLAACEPDAGQSARPSLCSDPHRAAVH